MLCRIIYYVQLAQEDADRSRRAICTRPEEVSRGADKVGDNKGGPARNMSKVRGTSGHLNVEFGALSQEMC